MNPAYQPGCVIKSKLGRDKGKYFMIYSYDGGDFVTLVDGAMRKQDAPKKKKIKHIEPTGVLLENLANKLQAGVHLFDAEIRRALEDAGFSNKPGARKKEG